MRSQKAMLVLVLLLAVAVSACLPQPTFRSEEFLDDQSLLTNEPCEPPCWNGITPGETLWSDAVQIIEDDAQFAGFQTNTEGGVIQGAWQKAGTSQYCCQMVADTDTSPVRFIFVALSPEIVVDEVLDHYGEPPYVAPFQFTDAEALIQLVYPDEPLVVFALVGEPSSSLLANSEIVAALYLSQQEMETILEVSELRAWAGYQPYAAYEEGTPVITPIATVTPAEG